MKRPSCGIRLLLTGLIFLVQFIGQPLGFAQSSNSTISDSVESKNFEDIDIAILQLQKKEVDLRARPLPEGIELISGIPNGAINNEYKEWQRLTNLVVESIDSRIQMCRSLLNTRLLTRDLEIQKKSWQGFPYPPPYSMSIVDSLQDKIKAQQLPLRNNEMQLPVLESELTVKTSLLKESRNLKRIAEERLESSRGKPEEARQRWLLALATRNNEVNEQAVMQLETWRQALWEGSQWLRENITFLEQQFSHAAADYRFTQEELNAKYKALDTRRDQLEHEVMVAAKLDQEALVEQQKVVEALREAIETVKSSTISPNIEKLKQLLEVHQFRVLTSSAKVGVLKGMIQLIQVERRVWQARFQLANQKQAIDSKELVQLQKDLVELQRGKNDTRTTLDQIDSHIRSQDARASSPDLSEEDRQTALTLLAIVQEAKTLFMQLSDAVLATDQLIQRLFVEISVHAKQENFLLSGLAKYWGATVEYINKIWRSELYIADEQILIDGRKIIKSRSVTVGKVLQACLIFVVGIFLAKFLIRFICRLAVNKFHFSENNAQTVSRITFYVLFVCILVFSLVSVNIPLAVFAFFGGALAIGLGFGGQTLINNFISGIILLFDRTIRINDIVEVDGHRGVVTAIYIRRSQIRRFDGVEMLIPNSHFLQQNVVNLTLSDRHTRYEVAIGVAYGTPTRAAEAVILRAVQEQPEVLKHPASYAVFENFGDSALCFRAFFWLMYDPKIITVNVVLSEIRHRIGEYLTMEGIGIPFPRRDVSLDSKQPFEVVIRHESGASY
jgi:potassium-dependent mechanosensitive channel